MDAALRPELSGCGGLGDAGGGTLLESDHNGAESSDSVLSTTGGIEFGDLPSGVNPGEKPVALSLFLSLESAGSIGML